MLAVQNLIHSHWIHFYLIHQWCTIIATHRTSGLTIPKFKNLFSETPSFFIKSYHGSFQSFFDISVEIIILIFSKNISYYSIYISHRPRDAVLVPWHREISFSPPKITIRFSPLFGLRFKNKNFGGDFGISMEKISSGDFSNFYYWFAKIPFSPPNRR